MSVARQPGSTTDRGVALADQRGAGECIARTQRCRARRTGVSMPVRRRSTRRASRQRRECAATRLRSRRALLGIVSHATGGFDAEGVDHERAAGHEETDSARGTASRNSCGQRFGRDSRSVTAISVESVPAYFTSSVRVISIASSANALRAAARRAASCFERARMARADSRGHAASKRTLDRLLAHHVDVGEADAVGGQHARERMDEIRGACRARRRPGRRAGRRRRRSRRGCTR